jgi:FecR protein
MKSSAGFAASSSATSAISTNKLFRVHSYFLIALIAILLTCVLPFRAGAQEAITYEPEIVRLSFVQGDVRLSRGTKNAADLNASWEIAKANVPVEEGFTLATGAGRAEIEFENGSVIYLADNSVLEFNRLDATYGVPATELELVTGTLTVNARPALQETFVISTPSERLSFPVADLVRVDSFLDGVTATPENSKGEDVIEYGGDATPPPGAPITTYFNGIRYTVTMPAGLANAISELAARNRSTKTHLDAGQPITYQNSKRMTGNVANDSGAPADWDAWVLARVTKREQEMSAALKASGLTASVPGLIDMYESGAFYPCAPDGICWRPNGADNSAGVIDLGDGAVLPDGSAIASDAGVGAALIASLGAPAFPTNSFLPLQSQQSSQLSQSGAQQPAPGTIPPVGPQRPNITVYRVRLDECSDEVRRQEVMTDPVTGKRIILSETIEHDPWMWGVCYSGGWIPFRGRYRFVAGRTHHHPVHYMHIGNKNGWVPRNPHDVRGQTPLNLKNGAFAAGKKPEGPLQFVKWNPSEKVTLLTKTPKEFRLSEEKTARMPVQRPEIRGHLATRNPVTTARTQPGAKFTPVAIARTGEHTITYNYHARTFERAGSEPVGGHASAKPEVVGHFTANGQFNNGANGSSRGNGGTTAGGRTSGGGGNGGYSGGGHSGGSSGGNSGGHSGGGGSSGGGGGGGGHSGGGGGSSGGGGGGGGGGHSGGGGGGGGSSGGGGGHGH